MNGVFTLLPLGTGCQRERDVAQVLTMPGRWCLYGSIGSMSHEFDAGGPIDAPITMPAGGTSNTVWTGGRDSGPLVRQLETRRA